MELSAWELGRELHLAGLFIDSDSRKLAASLEGLRTRRRARIHEIVQKLATLGIIIEAADVFELASSDSVGRPHVAEAMVRAGVVRGQEEAFARFLGDGAPAYVPRQALTLQENAQLMREAGGILVWAHPGEPPQGKALKQLIDAGVEGIEAYTPMHTPEVTEAWLRLAEEYDLLVSGGSDFHGNRAGNDAFGAVGLSRNVFDELCEEIEARKNACVDVTKRAGK